MRSLAGRPCRHLLLRSFKDGIAPEWEDAANITGGEWNLRTSAYDSLDVWGILLVEFWCGRDESRGIVDVSIRSNANAYRGMTLWLSPEHSSIVPQITETLRKLLERPWIYRP